MGRTLRRLTLASTLLVLACTVLLLSDLGGRAGARGGRRSGPANIHLITYINSPTMEEGLAGVLAGLKETGLVRDRDYRLTTRNAQGDMATASALIDAAVTERADMLMVLATPTLQAAVKRGRKTSTVFTLVANPVLAGAGRSNEEHLPHIAGVYSMSPFEEMMVLLKECLPGVRRIGTLYTPAEVNSVFYVEKLSEEARKHGLELVKVPITATADVPDAARTLCGGGLDALVQVSDNLTSSCFTAIGHAAHRARVPVFAFSSPQIKQGASVVFCRDFFDGGREAAALAARVLRGESPGAIPFSPIKKTKLLVNKTNALHCHLDIPSAVLARANTVVE